VKERRRRRVDPGKAAASAMGGEVAARGFYSRIPEPEKIMCSRCGEERNSVGQEEGVCLRCRWEERKAVRT
jgi:hypothetical protein